MGLQPLAYWDWGFESRRGHGCLSLISVVCCQVEVSAMDRSLRVAIRSAIRPRGLIAKPRNRVDAPRGAGGEQYVHKSNDLLRARLHGMGFETLRG